MGDVEANNKSWLQKYWAIILSGGFIWTGISSLKEDAREAMEMIFFGAAILVGWFLWRRNQRQKQRKEIEEHNAHLAGLTKEGTQEQELRAKQEEEKRQSQAEYNQGEHTGGFGDMLDYDFIAIDFETATTHMDSACSIGIAMVKNGAVVDTFYSLIQPPANVYDPDNTKVHGLSSCDTVNAPTFDDLWPQIFCYFGRYPVIAHNARFDMSVLAMCAKSNWIDIPNFKYMDTINLAKDIVPGNKTLRNCVDYFGIDLSNHHNAVADAVACAEVALACVRHAKRRDLLHFAFSTPNVKIHNFSSLTPMEELERHRNVEQPEKRKAVYNPPERKSEVDRKFISPKSIHPQTTSFDENHPLYKKTIVFTGDLSIYRDEAMQLAVDVGAIVRGSVSGKTNYLVVGMQDIDIVGDDGMSRKEEKAHELNQSGKANINIIGEKEFLELINWTPETDKKELEPV